MLYNNVHAGIICCVASIALQTGSSLYQTCLGSQQLGSDIFEGIISPCLSLLQDR